MLRKWVIATLIIAVFSTGCTALKKSFGAPKETPELEAARMDCENRTNRTFDRVKRADENLSSLGARKEFYNNCMKKKGYDHLGRKITH